MHPLFQYVHTLSKDFVPTSLLAAYPELSHVVTVDHILLVAETAPGISWSFPNLGFLGHWWLLVCEGLGLVVAASPSQLPASAPFCLEVAHPCWAAGLCLPPSLLHSLCLCQHSRMLALAPSWQRCHVLWGIFRIPAVGVYPDGIWG